MSEILEEYNDVSNDIKWVVSKELSDGSLRKIIEKGGAEKLGVYTTSISSQFLQHVYTKREHAKSYQTDQSLTLSKEHNKKVVLVQVDFSENYSCILQQEVQSYH